MTTRETTREGSSRPPLVVLAAVAAVVVVGIGLRFVTKSDLWLDEALSVNVAHLPLDQIPSWLRHDGAPPLYYFLLHFWMQVFGTSDLAVRSLSGVFAVASLVPAWYCGKRIGGHATAWAAVIVLSASPYAVVYATSARMYSLEIFVVFVGILAVRRAFERPTLERVALVGLLAAIVVYLQYWGFYLVLAVGLFLLATIARVPQHRAAAMRMLIATAVGVATFAPWIPTFVYQAKHTGTPWGEALLPPTPIGLTFQDFSGGNEHEGWMLLLLLIPLVLIGLFGATVDRRHIDLDLHTRPDVRWEAAVGALTLVIGTTLAWLGGSAFQTRYASIMFPFFVLVVARGITRFGDPTVRTWILVAVVALGFVGGVRNVATNRTQAGEVAAIIRAEAEPSDIVLYCPDQVGPAVHRLLRPGLGVVEMTYPLLRPPALVDWVDYEAVLAKHTPAEVASEVLERAGNRTIWFVSAPGYRTHVATCDDIARVLAQTRPQRSRVAPNEDFFEKPGLQEFPAH